MKRLLLTTAAVLAVPTLAFAQDAEDTRVDDVVVTATRLPAPVQDTPGARRIDQADIARRGATFAAELLADVPGLSVVRSGAFGGLAQVRIRGASPGKTLVLVDGVPVNDAAEISGAFDFAGFDLAEVAAVEVLSGPQSSLWGSDAIGGVIAFTTRPIDGLEAEVEAGSFSTLRGRLAVGRDGPEGGLSASVSRFETDGVSAADEADGNPEADGFVSTTVAIRGRRELGSGVRLDGSVRWNTADADIDGFPAPAFALADTPDTQSSEQGSAVLGLTVPALGLDHRFSASASRIERETVSAFPSVFEADRTVLRWQADGRLAGAAVAFGAEREATSGDLSSGLSADFGTTSAFATARLEPTPRLSLTGAVRLDDTDEFGSEVTGRVSGAYDLGRGLIASAAWGSGFKAPSVSQALCDFCFSAASFPVLRPERAEGYEAALGWSSSDGRVTGRVTAYRLNVVDQIDYVFDPVTFDAVYVNIDETATDGVELEGRARLGRGFDLTLAWAWTDARDVTTGARLLRVPERSGSAILGWTGDRLSGALTLRGESDQDDAGGVRDGFVTANLAAAWRLTDQVELTGRIDNLADERFQQVRGYGEPGRAGHVGIRLRY